LNKERHLGQVYTIDRRLVWWLQESNWIEKGDRLLFHIGYTRPLGSGLHITQDGEHRTFAGEVN